MVMLAMLFIVEQRVAQQPGQGNRAKKVMRR
jgi:hypothetical protein